MTINNIERPSTVDSAFDAVWKFPDSVVYYSGNDICVGDYRTYGTAPTIKIDKANNVLRLLYKDKNGKSYSETYELPLDTETLRLAIYEDGTTKCIYPGKY